MKHIIKRYSIFIHIVYISIFIVGCSGASTLKEGEILYTGAKIKIKSEQLNKNDISELKKGTESKLSPKPNASFLGIRPRLYFYKWAGETKQNKGLRYWIKNKLGEKPILLQDVDREFNKEITVNYAENIGYFNTKVRYDTLTKGRTAKVLYTITPYNRYFIDTVNFLSNTNEEVMEDIKATQKQSLIKPQEPYNLEIIKKERLRIDTYMKENGYYYFSPDNIIIQADSTIGNNKIAVNVKLKDQTPELSKKKFSIDKVIIYPDYSIQNIERGSIAIPTTTDGLEVYKDMYIVDPEKKFKPQIFDKVMYFHSGEFYNRRDHNLTLKRLINLGVFKFVKNQFIISDSLNNKFDAYYLLTPNNFQSLRMEALGKTNSANFNGGEININWLHRNLFKGAEQLRITAYGGMDVQAGGPRAFSNILRFGGNAQLTFPRIIAPFKFHTSSEFVPRTQVNLGYDYQRRTGQYTLHNFSTSFGYLWKENAQREHDLKIFSATYVNPKSVSNEYKSLAKIYPNLARAIERQLVFGPMYQYTYTNTIIPRTHQFYFRGIADLSANLTGLLSNANVKEGRQKTILGVPFSQYAKLDTDFRYYYNINSKNTLTARLMMGLAYPYGNSITVPFSRQFFVGGSNSIRAFRARTLGPGSYDPRNQQGSFFLDQAGDIRLETNLEYRLNLYRFLNLGLFLDAGNIWLINDDPTRPGAKFGKDWASEIAIGGGLGLRFDFNIFVLRTDLAIPIRVPYYNKGERWRFNHIDFNNSSWRKDNLILNIAIGYPF
ncbi:BamA/TamA family outer membrane protein [Riemerella anatipestifer]|uniref:translocation and assembly module lipoprotein TamL n=1 Tax=Riemerella anatipestifer TaxID=34085 RepID=UPI002363913F|nr:BamA/TamA family outer membrane protein [Riemerella anatipestifer]MDD1538112.1 BamA/TamA family outer membrane protein [Riemerella anatipestifer]